MSGLNYHDNKVLTKRTHGQSDGKGRLEDRLKVQILFPVWQILHDIFALVSIFQTGFQPYVSEHKTFHTSPGI